MSDAPERIFANAAGRWFRYEVSTLARDPGAYVRADLYAALEAENKRLMTALHSTQCQCGVGTMCRRCTALRGGEDE